MTPVHIKLPQISKPAERWRVDRHISYIVHVDQIKPVDVGVVLIDAGAPTPTAFLKNQ